MPFKKRSNSFRLLVLIASFPSWFAACTYEKEKLDTGTNPQTNCATIPASFNAVIFPLVTTKCAISGCHDATASGGRVFQNYSQISGARDQIYLRAIVQKTMPATGFLTTAEYTALKCWIEAGAPNN